MLILFLFVIHATPREGLFDGKRESSERVPRDDRRPTVAHRLLEAGQANYSRTLTLTPNLDEPSPSHFLGPV